LLVLLLLLLLLLLPLLLLLQVSWLLLALLQDQPGNQHIRLFKDACERAALTGTWVRNRALCVHGVVAVASMPCRGRVQVWL
jgi:hypothetical protein